MNAQEAIKTRRTAHKWSNDVVPEEVIQRGLEAAHWAPCHRLTWPWRFTLPGQQSREALYELGVTLKANKAGTEITPGFRKRMRAKLLHPALVVVSQIRVDDPMQSEEDYAACSCAIQNLCLSVHAEGFYSKWSTGGLTRHADTYAQLGIDSDQERIIGFVWIGVPVRVPSTPERPNLSEFIRRVP